MNKTLRLLLVEDSEDDAELLLWTLRQGGHDLVHACVSDAPAMNAALDAAPWDLVIADYSLPHFSGIAALELVKARGLDIPFIIVSGHARAQRQRAIEIHLCQRGQRIAAGTDAATRPSCRRQYRRADAPRSGRRGRAARPAARHRQRCPRRSACAVRQRTIPGRYCCFFWRSQSCMVATGPPRKPTGNSLPA